MHEILQGLGPYSPSCLSQTSHPLAGLAGPCKPPQPWPALAAPCSLAWPLQPQLSSEDLWDILLFGLISILALYYIGLLTIIPMLYIIAP